MFTCSNNNKELSQSKKFYTIKDLTSENFFKIKFISLDGTAPNTELRENVDYYIWIDDYKFIFSIKNKGIYLYNLNSNNYTKIEESTSREFKIIEYKDNILKYDEKMLNLK